MEVEAESYSKVPSIHHQLNEIFINTSTEKLNKTASQSKSLLQVIYLLYIIKPIFFYFFYFSIQYATLHYGE